MKTIRIGYSASETISTGSRQDGYGGSEPEDTFEIHKIRHIDFTVEDGFRCSPISIAGLIDEANAEYEREYERFWDLPILERNELTDAHLDKMPRIESYDEIISWSVFE
jgi:hypothetical protein